MIAIKLKISFRNAWITSAQQKTLLCITVLLALLSSCTGMKIENHYFDYFVFSQRWLPTACIEYLEHGSSHPAQCILPQNFDFWAIHGLWPTQKSHIGPFFCNRSMPFDVNNLLPIQADLQLVWPNIEAGKSVSSLWQHEWEKHGTCAAQLNSFSSEFKYFNITLNLYKSYNIQKLLEKYIKPSLSHTIYLSDIFSIVKGTFKKLPQIHCIHEVKTGRPYLSEIRLCYNKNLELIDCGNMFSIKSNSILYFKNLTDCPLNDKVYIPDEVNSQINKKVYAKNSEKKNYYNTLLHLLYFLKFLMWASI